MSRIGKKPIEMPGQVTVEMNGQVVSVKGPLGSEQIEMRPGISIKKEGSTLLIEMAESNDKKLNALHGLYRAIIANMIEGVTKGFERELEITGVGYRAQQQGKDIQFHLGFSHPVFFKAPEGVILEVLEQTKLKVKGSNKEKVGQTAAEIRFLKPPEPYKGKGIRFKNENVRRKAGKSGKK
ncbi:MAG TPA: 50S ribosomal protein L6 [Spirochaetota bacterium]|nr:50S ribosomal protein L6 [Spirochaetota bacterium]